MSGRLISDIHPEGKVLDSVSRILEQNHLCSIATGSADGTSHINTAYFSFTDICKLYFLSKPATTHCRNIANRPNVCLTIFDSRQAWGGSLLGLQMFGESSLADGDDLAWAKNSYSARFQSYKTWMESLSEGERPAVESRFYVIDVQRLKLLDEAAFGDETYVEATVDKE